MPDNADTPPKGERPSPSQRLQSLDAYRGLIMISLAFAGFGLARTAANFLERNPDSGFWQQVKHQFSHVEWVGCGYWDLIQPSFMFMVGVSMAYSYAARKRRGESYPQMLLHAVVRSLVLIALGIFLMSATVDYTKWSFMNVLIQIGLGYTFLFLLWSRPTVVQWVAALVLLAATWGAYKFYPTAGIDLSTGDTAVGVSQEWAAENLTNVRPAWHKNANVGHAVDLWLLNQFPQPQPFQFNRGGYQTINFIPSLVTMLFGLMCGELLRSERSNNAKLLTLLVAGAVGIAFGLLLHQTGVSPLVKRLWTPSWAIFSTGWCCWILGSLFGVVDVVGWRRWTFPLVVVGMNSILIYCMSILLRGWTAQQLQTHLGNDVFTFYGQFDPAWAPAVQATMVGMVFWLICYYLYRNKIYLRI